MRRLCCCHTALTSACLLRSLQGGTFEVQFVWQVIDALFQELLKVVLQYDQEMTESVHRFLYHTPYSSWWIVEGSSSLHWSRFRGVDVLYFLVSKEFYSEHMDTCLYKCVERWV